MLGAVLPALAGLHAAVPALAAVHGAAVPALAGLHSGVLASAASSGAHLAHASAWVVFATGAVLILAGAFGVILLRNPVHCALMLVVTLFGVAIEFIDESADFLAAVQIIVYAGAVVILFLFVIMFLGVDRRDAVSREPLRAQRPLAILLGVVTIIEILILSRVQYWSTGYHGSSSSPGGFAGAANGPGENVQKLGQSIYTRYLLPFEMTAALLLIAVVAAVVLSRPRGRVASDMTRAEQEGLVAE
jgi:NADH-quinone oxidoreductase subunit J